VRLFGSGVEMAATADFVHAQISVGGDVNGQIAIGENILQIGEHHGDLVMVAAPGSIPAPTLRPLPARMVPRRPQPFFGRRAEVAFLAAEAGAGRCVAVHGPRGIGRSTLLRYVATQENLQSVAYLPARDLTLDDAVQMLFDAFYQCDMPFRPTPTQAMSLLQQIRATIVVDDVDTATVRGLIDLAPNCGFVLAATSSPVEGMRSVQLSGLADDDARALFERGLGRSLRPDELDDADQLCLLAENSPSRVLETAALAGSSNQPLHTFAETVRNTGTPSGPQPAGDDLRLIDLLAAVPGLVMPESWLTALADVPDAVDRLRRWVANGHVIEVPDAGYQLGERRSAPADTRTAVVEYAVRLAQTQRTLMRCPGPVIEALKNVHLDCTQHGDWQAVLAIGAVLDPVYAQTGRWDAWRDVLARMLTAARALGDRAAEARALHQLGTRELCLLATGTAAGLLAVALRIRQMIGDSAGAAATQHNIALIPSIAAPTTGHRQTRAGRASRPRVLAAAAGTALMTVAATTVAVTLTSASPVLSFDSAGLVFPARPVSAPGPTLVVDLVNSGKATAHVTTPRTLGTNATDFDVTATTCGTELTAGQHCSTTVAFVPLAEGMRTTSLAVDVAEGASGARVALTGTGSAPVGATVSPTSLDFTDQTVATTSPMQAITLTAPGTGNYPVGGLAVAGGTAPEFALVDDPCSGTTIPSRGSCVVGVQFTPQTPGKRSAHLQIVAADGSATADVPLHGIGTMPPGAPPPGITPPPRPGPATAVVPYLRGQNVAEAGPLLKDAGLRVDALRQSPDDNVPAATILGSQPAAEARVDIGTAVTVFVSSGPPRCTVPDVINQPVETATQTINGTCAVAGLSPTEPSETVPKNAVIRTVPGAGASVTKRSVVRLVVSRGGVRVPNVVGQSRTDADNAIANAGLVVDTAHTTHGTEQRVVATNPAAGVLVAPGSNVALTYEDVPPPPSTEDPPPSEDS
jgi:PASTA domain